MNILRQMPRPSSNLLQCGTVMNVFAVMIAMTANAVAAPKPEEVKADAIPAIWQKVSPQQRLTAIRIAELDALRLLAERVYGVQLTEESTVRDLAKADDTVKTAVQQVLKGVTTKEGPTYFDDGRLEVVRAVKLSKVIEVVRETFKSSQGREIKLSHEVETRGETELIDALGNAALPGSDGHKKILAKRAAELDGYRKLAERTLGVQVSSNSTIKNMAVASDEIRAALTGLLKSAEVTRIVYLPDQSSEVTMKLAIGPLVKILKKQIEASGKSTEISITASQQAIEEIGRGAPAAAEAPASGGEPAAAAVITTVEVQNVIDAALKGE